jgi:hypothetical protein
VQITKNIPLILMSAVALACGKKDAVEDRADSAAAARTQASNAAAIDTTSHPMPAAVTAIGTYGEDLYDQAKLGDWKKAAILMDSLDLSSKYLPASDSRIEPQRTRLIGILDTLRTALNKHERLNAQEASNLVTYVSAKMTDVYRPPVPTEVLLLDFYGRELEIWSALKNQAKLDQTVADLKSTWESLKPAIVSRQGSALILHTDSLVAKIGAAKTPANLAKLATPFLDEVDEMEKVFTKQ